MRESTPRAESRGYGERRRGATARGLAGLLGFVDLWIEIWIVVHFHLTICLVLLSPAEDVVQKLLE